METFGSMVKRLRHRPFTAVTRVRFSSGSPQELEGKQSPIGWLFLYPFAFFAKAVRLRCDTDIDPYIIFKQNTYTRPVSSVGQSDRLLSGRPEVQILYGTPKTPPENPVKSRVSGVFSFLRENGKIVKITDFHQQILRQLMEIRTNVVRLSGVRFANKNQQDFCHFANENALSANGTKKRAKFLLMNEAVVTLLICSFRGGQATIAHYLYVLTYYIIAVTGGGCFERTEISFISFR